MRNECKTVGYASRIPMALLMLASLVAIGNLIWWAVDGISAPLFWDDSSITTCARQLLANPLQPSKWEGVLAFYPPSAYIIHSAILALWPAHFAPAAHLWQLAMLVTLCVSAFLACRMAEGLVAAMLTLGLFACWPIVPAVARQIMHDLPIATFGFLALLLCCRGHHWIALAFYGVACSLKLTAVGFLPALLWLNYRHAARHQLRAAILMVALSLLHPSTIAGALFRGHENANVTVFLNQPTIWGVLKLPIVHGLRHLLELGVYDGRWALSLALLIGVSSKSWPWSPRSGPEAFERPPGAAARTLFHAMTLAVCGVFIVATACGGFASLQRYLMPLAMPIAYVMAVVVTHSRSWLVTLCATAGIIQGILISNDLVPLLSRYETSIAEKVRGFGRAIDSRPAWMTDFVKTQAKAIDFIRRSGTAGPIGADWPAQFALTEPAFGYVQAALPAQPWKPGESTQGLRVLWVDAWHTKMPAVEDDWRKEFGERYRVVLLGLSNH